MDKVICAACTYGEGISGATCGYCGLNIVAWVDPKASEEVKVTAIQGWKRTAADREWYCEWKETPASRYCNLNPCEWESTNRQPGATNFLCQKHFEEMGLSASFRIDPSINASSGTEPVRIYDTQHGEIYVWNHGDTDSWFSCQSSAWSQNTCLGTSGHGYSDGDTPEKALERHIKLLDKIAAP